jgi:hypothetical protein
MTTNMMILIATLLNQADALPFVPLVLAIVVTDLAQIVAGRTY